MKPNGNSKPAVVRCAIYTRKSTDEGLDQEFNSLDAQRESAESYVRSQKHEGWTILDDRYDDGGFSGGTMARPALTRLLDDIQRKHVDVVVVYKVDRLSRSLLDFAKLMETFDNHGVSFVSVTQQFNTASSMGRLILNVLLSFAQFEREMIAERTKDKMGAARRKGKWVGGRPALGYDVLDGRLVVNADEAEQVRALYRLYLQERSFRRVAGFLNARGWRLKSWRNKEGKWVQGGEWDASAVHRHITNVVYVGKVDYEGAIYDGEHQPIIDSATFEQAARIRADGRIDRGAEARNTTGYLLRGLIRCMVCNSIMTTATSGSHGRIYRYYSCTKATKCGKNACSVRSVPGPEIENVLVDQLAKRGWRQEIAGRVAHAVNEKRRAQATALASEQRKLMSDLDRARVEGKNLLDLFTENEDLAQRKVVTERLAEIETRSVRMEARLAEIAAGWTTNEKLLVGADHVAKILTSFMAVWTVLSVKERARMLHVLFDKIEFNGEKEVLEMFFTDAAKLALAEPAGEQVAQGAA